MITNDEFRDWRDKRFHDVSDRKTARTEGERDRDRIIYSSALRRLSAVTQVVDPDEGRLFHNRLTHTIKVAQLAGSIARQLSKQDPALAEKLGGIDDFVTEAAGWAHDLGHPPFGHIGEKELDFLVRAYGLHDGYEGNAQSFRILTKLETGESDKSRLNLTRATLNAVLKYPWMYDRTKSEKWGVYWTEREVFEWARQGISKEFFNRRTLEAEIMDWADDIAFSIHDTDDFYCAGLIPHGVFNNPPLKDAILKRTLKRWESAKYPDDICPSHSELEEHLEDLRKILPLSAPYEGVRQQQAELSSATSLLTHRYVNDISLNEESLKDTKQRKVLLTMSSRAEIRILKELTRCYVIENESLATQQYGKRRIIRKLFKAYMDAIERGRADSKFILPEAWETTRNAIEEDLGKTTTNVTLTHANARFVADIISGLSDREAITLYNRLMGINFGSVLDKIY